MASKFNGDIKAGSTSIQIPFQLRKSADSTELTGQTSSTITAYYTRNGAAPVAITLSVMATMATAWASGAVMEINATNAKGGYNLCAPDACFAAGADWVMFSIFATASFVENFWYTLGAQNASDITLTAGGVSLAQILSTTLTETIAGNLAGGLKKLLDVSSPAFTLASINQSGDVYPRIGLNGAGLTALGDTRLAFLDAAISGRMATFTLPTHFSTLAIDSSGQVTFNNSGVATLANQTTIINAINGISNVSARSGPRVPDFMARPASGSVAYLGDLFLYAPSGALEGADGAAVTVHARNAAGTSLDAALTSTTMAVIAAGHYRFTYTVNSADTAQAVYFDFSWAISAVAMSDGAATEVQDAENYAFLAAIKAQTDKLGFDGSSNVKASVQAYPGNTVQTGDVGNLIPARLIMTGGKIWVLDDNGNSLPATVWQNATRVLTAGTNIVLAKGTGVTGLNDIPASAIVSAGPINTLTGAVQNVNNLVNAPTVGDFTDTMKTSLSSGGAPTVEQIDSQLSESHGSGAWGGSNGTGANTVVIHVTDGTNPVVGALVRLTINNMNLMARSNVNGDAPFGLDNGTYGRAITLNGYSFTPDSIAVVASQTIAAVLTSVVIPAPTNPMLCTFFGTVTAADQSTTKAVVSITPTGRQVTGGPMVSNEPIYPPIVNGAFSIDLIRTDAGTNISGYRIVCASLFLDVHVPVAQPTLNIAALLP